MKLYHEFAEYYFTIEKKHRDINDDVALISGLLEGVTEPSLLDLGCGTGEHLHLRSRLGVPCTGIDNSGDMLRTASRRFPGAARYIELDMNDIDYHEDFHMVMSLFGSFNYLLEDTNVDRVFRNTWRALKPGGMGLFEIWNAAPVRKIHTKEPDLVSVTHFERTRIERERGFTLLGYPDRTIVEVRYNYTLTGDGGRKSIKDRHVMRAFDREEMETFIRENGFILLGAYSSSRREPYRETSNRIIMHFRKP